VNAPVNLKSDIIMYVTNTKHAALH